MDRPSIDLKYIFGRGISSLVPLHRSCLYTTVYISSPTSTCPRPLRQKTPLDTNNANNPEWNNPIRLYLDPNHQITSSDLSLKFDIKTQVPVLGDKLVGCVQVPLVDLAKDGPTGTLRHVTYQVINPDEKTTNGVLSFCYILNEAPVKGTDTVPVQDTVMLNHGSSYLNFCNNVDSQEVYPPVKKLDSEPQVLYPPVKKPDSEPQVLYPPVKKPDSKPQFYPTLDVVENATPFVSRSLKPDPNPEVYPPTPMPESKPNLYPVVSTEPVIAYPVIDSGVKGYSQYSPSMVSYPQVEPVGAIPGYYSPPQASAYCYQTHGWDGRYW